MIKKKTYKIGVIGGDGIGPEVIGETIKLLKHIPIKFDFVQAEAGYSAYKKYQTPLPQKTIDICQKSDAVLFGAVTTPPNIPNYFSPIVKLRKILDLYANVRPFFSLPLNISDKLGFSAEQVSERKESQQRASSLRLPSSFNNSNNKYLLSNQHYKQNSMSTGGNEFLTESGVKSINLIIVRENTEDLYVGRERLTDDGAIAERVITKKACEKIVDYAFKLAVHKKFKKVTAVHKANVLRITDGLFLDIARKIAQKYPKIVFDELLVDACAMKLIKKPEEFEVIVTTNMFGDILSDETAALVGGLGVAASANIGENLGLFEPVHGSAPKYEGKNSANPLASFFAACMMLEFLGEKKQADKIREAIMRTIAAGKVTVDLGGKLTMTEFTNEIINNINI